MNYKGSFYMLVAVAAMAVLGPTVQAAGPGPVMPDNKPVDFDLFERLTPIGDSAALPAAPHEGVLLMQFWASWCHSCGVLMWDMDEIVSANDGIGFLSVSLDDEVDVARRYVRKHALFSKYRQYYFVDDQKALSAALGVETVPSILLVSAGGEVLLRKTGHLNSTDFGDIADAIRNHH